MAHFIDLRRSKQLTRLLDFYHYVGPTSSSSAARRLGSLALSDDCTSLLRFGRVPTHCRLCAWPTKALHLISTIRGLDVVVHFLDLRTIIKTDSVARRYSIPKHTNVEANSWDKRNRGRLLGGHLTDSKS